MNTVIRVTEIITKISENGTRPNVSKVDHSKVPITTINITPTSAAIGIWPMTGPPTMMNKAKVTAAVTPEVRPRPPDFMLMRLWPIIAHPPMPPKRPDRKLAPPCAIHSRFPWPLVSVRSSMSCSVMSDSMIPTIATAKAVPPMTLIASMFQTISVGRCGIGKAPLRVPLPVPSRRTSDTVRVSAKKKLTKPTMTIATRVEGSAFVNFGNS